MPVENAIFSGLPPVRAQDLDAMNAHASFTVSRPFQGNQFRQIGEAFDIQSNVSTI